MSRLNETRSAAIALEADRDKVVRRVEEDGLKVVGERVFDPKKVYGK